MRKELKRMRVSNFLTQENMAKRCGTSRNNYSFIEKGKREGSVEFWLTLAQEFKLTIDELEELRKNESEEAECEETTEK